MKIKLTKIFLLNIVMFFSNNIFSQMHYDVFSKKIATLKENKIDTIVTYKSYLIGGSYINSLYDTTCHTNTIYIIFWKKNGQLFKQRIDDCKTNYAEQKVLASPFFKLVNDSLQIIKVSEIKRVSYSYENRNGNLVTGFSSIDHSEHSDFTFYFDKKEFSKNIDHYELDTKFIDKYLANENYENNQRSILKLLVDSVTKEL